ncbi:MULTISPECIES: AraC family transcriptional regulator [Flavobacterium]|uniref:AraC family transcriptional regulator n=1 Tax=Flavobacterium TaxID=237 RepID=UPI002115A624|nr:MULTISPECIES: AraC family transcriptional regulator [Flavobacterium]UUF13101.1 AraC family transcriptional regulator [Flavobacterium panici]
MKQHIFDSSLKTIGMVQVNSQSLDVINSEAYKSYIKVLYVSKGCKVKVDFKVYDTSVPSLFFISPNQVLSIEELCDEPGQLIFYNQDFYCIQLHDDEVACDGLLYNNIHNMPMTAVPKEASMYINSLFLQIEDEFKMKDCSQEEMLRTYLKQLFIKSTRLWKIQHLDGSMAQKNNDVEFFRRFTQLVEENYKKKHSVADYADILTIAPKTLTHKFKRLNLPQPNEIIKSRIILEAKRLLVHTSKSAKEIAYDLGYEDPSYFSRLFFIKTGETPVGFKSKYLSSEDANLDRLIS